jgi:hypothetical protein
VTPNFVRPSDCGTALRRRWLRVACVLVASWWSFAMSATPAAEYHVKAAYLFNFGQFVEWPPQAYEAADAPFVIGVVGDDPFGTVLDEVVAGESLGGHAFVIKRFRNPKDISACHILFIGRNESARLDETLQVLKGRSVLTVTDIAGAEHRGAMIVLVNDRNRIRMRINVAAAKSSNLAISSKLLRPAEVVGNEGVR